LVYAKLILHYQHILEGDWQLQVSFRFCRKNLSLQNTLNLHAH